MKDFITIIRILHGKDIGYHDISSRLPIPHKGDNIAFKSESYVVMYVEFDYDSSTVYITVS